MANLLVPFLALMALTPNAQALPESGAETANAHYESCIAEVSNDLAKGRDDAARWVAEGGGAPSQHCLAVADLAAGFPKLAAVRLQELAERPDAGDALVRARIYSQAALAWVEAEQPDQAGKAIESAFAAAPEAGELYLTAASVYAAKDEQQATVDAVTKAEEAGFVSVKGYVLRGRALHKLARHREAADDVVAALSIDPFDVDALVLRGDLMQAGVAIDANYKNTSRTP